MHTRCSVKLAQGPEGCPGFVGGVLRSQDMLMAAASPPRLKLCNGRNQTSQEALPQLSYWGGHGCMAASGSISSCSGMKRQHASNLLPADPQTTANPFGCLKTRCFASCLQAKPAHAGKFDPGSRTGVVQASAPRTWRPFTRLDHRTVQPMTICSPSTHRAPRTPHSQPNFCRL